VQLRVVEPYLADDPQHLLRLLVHEHPDLEDGVLKGRGYLSRLLDTQLARALREDQADGVSAGAGRHPSVLGVGNSTDFYLNHNEKSLLPY
jgi:hypothetical protein